MVTDNTTTTENRCYRHPNRETFVKCQRCGRPICGQCQTLAPVGVHCPECVREARGSAASSSAPLGRRVGRMLSPSSGRPVVTYSIIAVAVIVFVLETITGNNPLRGDANGPVGSALAYFPGDILHYPWTVITVNFVHANLPHLALNMISLVFLGPVLESYLGRVRFAVLFFLSGVGGVVALDFLSNSSAVGASGAIFGLLGALILLYRRLGYNPTQLIVIGVVNLLYGFWDPAVAWQAHLGGLIVGLAVGAMLLRTRGVRRRAIQIVILIAVAVVLLGSLLIHALVTVYQ
jgi:membrane associated rhomboid family serine protease